MSTKTGIEVRPKFATPEEAHRWLTTGRIETAPRQPLPEPALELRQKQEAMRAGFSRSILPPRVRLVIERVAAQHEIRVEHVLRKDNRPTYVAARRAIAQELVTMGFSISDIGRLLNRHHTTVLAYFRRPMLCAAPLDAEWDASVADLSGEWAI